MKNTSPFFAYYKGDNYINAFKKCKKSLLDNEISLQKKYYNVTYKDSLTAIPLDEWCAIGKPTKVKAMTYAKKLLFNDDDRITDKWRQMAVIEYSDGEYLFFGWIINA